MRYLRGLFNVVFFSACILTQSIAQPSVKKSTPAVIKAPDRFSRIDNLLKNAIDSGWINGAIGYIAKDGRVMYHKAFGVSDASVAMRPDAIFRIASQTKAITSVAIMMLFEEGKLLLDDPVSKYIPSFSKPVVLDQFTNDTTFTIVPAKREVTIRDLLTHTSGIDYAAIGSARMKAIYARAGIPSGLGDAKISSTLKQSIPVLGKLPLLHQPGERFTYGLNTDVLGYVVELLSGETLDQFFRNRIFAPLGMNDTWFYLPDTKQSRLVAVYTTSGPQQRLIKMERNNPDYPKEKGTYYSGGAGLSSTITDYAIFLQMLLNGGVYNGHRILSKRSVELMTTNQIGDLNVGVNKFGLGFEITSEKGFLKYGMSKGSFAWGGFFGTTYWVDPSEKLVCELFIQQTPLRSEVQDKFKALVYQALEQ